MAAGLGFKTFNTGDILSASDVNGYLMQGVLVFTDSTGRSSQGQIIQRRRTARTGSTCNP